MTHFGRFQNMNFVNAEHLLSGRLVSLSRDKCNTKEDFFQSNWPSISKSEWSNNQVHGLYQIHKLCAAFNVNQDVKTRGHVGAPFLATNSSYVICSDMPE